MGLKLYNSLTRTKEDFTPLNPPFVGMYVCGPTVYGHPHLGHARSYVVFDTIYRYLTHLGYKVRYIQNITDVGHLVGDVDDGEDKISKQAKREKLEPVEIAYKYEVSYFKNMDRLNILRPSISSRATGHIIEMIEHISKLIEKGNAYATPEGNVYFDVRSFKEYGKLSGRTVEETLEGERIEVAQDKKNTEDFALWKRAEKEHLMQWPSPWGYGYPGWHIECSTMSMKYIGETLDIHGGGIDNIFPHHECEIAQSEALTGKSFIKYFIHHNLLTVNGTKMGKSLGNFIVLDDLFSKYDPTILRFYILQGHYRSPLDFTYAAIDASKSGFERLKRSVFTLRSYLGDKQNNSGQENNDEHTSVKEIRVALGEAMNDDFNTAHVIALLYDLLKISNDEVLKQNPDIGILSAVNRLVKEFGEDILGLLFDNSESNSSLDDSLINYIIELRRHFRDEKNFSMSDKIRDDLLALGVTIKDGKNGTTYVK